MTDRPILFSAPMVRALLDGSKTQTRRVVKPQPYLDEMGNACWNGYNFGQDANRVPHFKQLASPLPSSKTKRVHCPYGKTGERLWVREAWAHDAPSLEECRAAHDDVMGGSTYGPYYRATESAPDTLKWRPSIHMPRWASRITLEIIGVRVERLQDISESDAKAEGVKPNDGYSGPECDRVKGWRKGYKLLWESINGPSSWDANPWVWVVEFNRVEGGAA